MFCFCRAFSLFSLLIFSFFLKDFSTQAQENVFRIAAIANDKIITVSDIDNRLNLILATSSLESTPEMIKSLKEQILKSLIDEALEIQEAEKKGVTVNQEEVDKAIGYIEKQNDKPEGSLKEHLKTHEIPLYALEDQVRANISWLRLISEQYGPTITITDKEVDQTLKKIQDSLGSPQVKASEIFLSIDSLDKEQEVLRVAKGLSEDIKKGASFDMLARQFSEAPSASAGGDIGWVSKGQLDEAIDKVLFSMKEGEVSGPIQTKTGVYILLVNEKAQETIEKETFYTLKNIILPVFLDKSSEAIDRASTQVDSIKGEAISCDSLETIADKILGRVETMENVPFSNIPGPIQEIIRSLPVETPSETLKTPEGAGFIMICNKEEKSQKVELPDKEIIRQKLISQKLELIARRVLRDLRRAAFIETRV